MWRCECITTMVCDNGACMLQHWCMAMLQVCYGNGVMLCDIAERVLWQWCMAMCVHSVALICYSVHDNLFQHSHKKFHLLIY